MDWHHHMGHGIRRSEEWLQQRLAERQVKPSLQAYIQNTLTNEAALAAAVQDAPRKFRNQVTEEGGDLVDSKKEAKRRRELRLMGRTGALTELAFQVEFFLGVHADEQGHSHVCVYKADAVWTDSAGQRHVEDTKSQHTRTLPVYRLKKRLMKACLGLDIEER